MKSEPKRKTPRPPGGHVADNVRHVVEVATVADVDEVIELGRTIHEVSHDRRLAYSEERVRKLLLHLIATPESSVLFVTRAGGRVVGGFAGGVSPQWYSEELVGFDYAFFVKPGARHGMRSASLVQAFVIWAQRRGAKQIKVGVTTGVDIKSTARLYESLGFRGYGVGFSKEV